MARGEAKEKKARRWAPAKPKRKPSDLEEEVERLSAEVSELKSSVKSLLLIYHNPPATLSATPVLDGDPSLFSLLFQCVRSLENEMDRIASAYMSDETPSVRDHRRMDSLYQDLVETLLRASPGLAANSLTLESLQEDDGLDISSMSTRIGSGEGDGYRREDEAQMLRSLRMVQQSMEGMLVKVARNQEVGGNELDALDHWYQIFASFR